MTGRIEDLNPETRAWITNAIQHTATLTTENRALRDENTLLRRDIARALAFLNTYRTWTGQHLADIWPDIDHLTDHHGGGER